MKKRIMLQHENLNSFQNKRGSPRYTCNLDFTSKKSQKIIYIKFYNLISMNKEIVEQKQKLIQHIQLKLVQLRSNRNKIEQRKYPHPSSTHEKKIRPSSAKIQKPNIIQKRKLENNLATLQRLYEGKKQLKSAGIVTNNPTQIYKYQNDPKLIEQLERKKKKVVEDEQKMKIIYEEVAKAQKFLKSKKISNKNIAMLQQMNYKYILQQKLEQLAHYDQLILKKGLTRIQKEELIQLTFQFLRQWNNIVRKQKFKNFLLANPQFCHHFFITHAQINRDLEVTQTKQFGGMDYRQFLEFIKSIQVTNPQIQPSLKNKMRNNKKEEQKLPQKQNLKADPQSLKLNDRQYYRKMLQYLRKVFKNLDRSSQSLIDRQKFILGIEKGLFLDPEKDKHINKQELKKISNYMTQKTKQKCKKSYYNELDAKYINFGEIEALCRQFYAKKQKQNKKQQSQQTNDQIVQEQKISQSGLQQQNNQDQTQKSSQFDLSEKQGKIITEQDYRRYGWDHSHQRQTKKHHQNPKVAINNIDSYYKEVGQKYGNEIVWAEYGNNTYKYKQEFKQLEAFIRKQDNKDAQSHKKCILPN